jgi:hypothetical protein
MKRLLLSGCVSSVLVLGCAHEPASVPAVKPEEFAMSDSPASQPSTRQTTFTGTLRGRIMAVGGETTGWRLERDDGTRVDVNVSKVRDALDGLDGKRVVIHGNLTTANWVERGRQPLIMAERIDPEPAR